MDAILIVDPIFSVGKLKSAARSLGYEVICVFLLPPEQCKNIWGTEEDKLFIDCTNTIISDDVGKILQEIKALNMTVRASIAGHESGVELADAIAEKLDLLRNNTTLTRARRDKGEMRKVLKNSGLMCPDYTTCTTLEQVFAFSDSHRFPLMMKTPKGAGTSQVFECTNRDQLKTHFHEIISEKNLYGLSSKEVVLEEYIPGDEYVVNTFSDGVDVHVTDCWVYEKIETEEHKNIYFNSFTIPIDAPEIQDMLEYALKVSKVFGVTRGVAHLEIKADPEKGPTLIELGARLPGVKMPDLVQKFSNFDPYKSQVEVFLHEKIQIPTPVVFKKHCGIAFCPILEKGKVTSMTGIEKIKKLPSYVEHMLNLVEGEVIGTSTQVTAIPLIVLLANESREKLEEDLENVHTLFEIELEK